MFAQEGIGRPDLEIETDIDRLTKFLKKNLPKERNSLNSISPDFFHPEVEIQVDDAPAPRFRQEIKRFDPKN